MPAHNEVIATESPSVTPRHNTTDDGPVAPPRAPAIDRLEAQLAEITGKCYAHLPATEEKNPDVSAIILALSTDVAALERFEQLLAAFDATVQSELSNEGSFGGSELTTPAVGVQLKMEQWIGANMEGVVKDYVKNIPDASTTAATTVTVSSTPVPPTPEQIGMQAKGSATSTAASPQTTTAAAASTSPAMNAPPEPFTAAAAAPSAAPAPLDDIFASPPPRSVSPSNASFGRGAAEVSAPASAAPDLFGSAAAQPSRSPQQQPDLFAQPASSPPSQQQRSPQPNLFDAQSIASAAPVMMGSNASFGAATSPSNAAAHHHHGSFGAPAPSSATPPRSTSPQTTGPVNLDDLFA